MKAKKILYITLSIALALIIINIDTTRLKNPYILTTSAKMFTVVLSSILGYLAALAGEYISKHISPEFLSDSGISSYIKKLWFIAPQIICLFFGGAIGAVVISSIFSEPYMRGY